MEVNNKKLTCGKIASIVFAICAVFHTLSFLRACFSGNFQFVTVLLLAGTAIIAYTLYEEKRDVLLSVGFGILTLIQLYSFFMGFRYRSYHVMPSLGGKFNLFLFLPALITLVGYVVITALVAAYTTTYMEKFKETVQGLWVLPAVCIIVSFVLSNIVNIIVRRRYGMYRITTGAGILTTILLTVGFYLVARWLVNPSSVVKKAEQQKSTVAGNSSVSTNTVCTDLIYCSLVKHILLLLFTCGVWMYIWIYRLTGYLNCVEDEEYRNPTTKLLLCMFVPFYSIYWTYKSAIRIDKLARRKGMQSDLSTLCLILAIFVPIIPPILMQDKVNAIVVPGTPVQASAPVQPVTYTQPATAQAESEKPAVDETELLKKYKDLLDSGVITQEEFDAKKKQILGL